MLEAAAGRAPVGDGDVAAEEHGRDEAGAKGGVGVDDVPQEPDEMTSPRLPSDPFQGRLFEGESGSWERVS